MKGTEEGQERGGRKEGEDEKGGEGGEGEGHDERGGVGVSGDWRSQFLHNIYPLTPVLIAPRVKVSGVKPRWLSYPSRFLIFPA